MSIVPSGDTSGATDFANIQAAINTALASTNGANRYIELSTGIYYINAKIVGVYNSSGLNNFAGRDVLQIVGLGEVQINQVTDNTGIFEFQCPVNSQVEQLFIQGLWFIWTNQQPSTNTNAVAIGVNSVALTATNENFFQVYINKVKFQNGYRAVANLATGPSDKMPFWGIRLTEFHCFSMSGSTLVNRSTVTVGCPNIEVEMGLVALPYLGGSEPIFSISACDNFSAKNIEVLQVTDQPIFSVDSTIFAIISCKLEACTYNPSAGGTIFTQGPIIASSSSGVIAGFTMAGIIVNSGTGTPPVFLTAPVNTPSGTRTIAISGLSMNIGSGTGTLTLVNNVATIQVNFLTPPSVTSLGTGPGVVRLTDSAHTASASWVGFSYPPGGEVSDNIGNASVTWKGFAPDGTSSPRTLIFNTALTAARTVTLPTTVGTATDNLWDGAEVNVVRTANATGSFNLTVTGSIPSSKVLSTASLASRWKWRQSLGWVEVQSGSL